METEVIVEAGGAALWGTNHEKVRESAGMSTPSIREALGFGPHMWLSFSASRADLAYVRAPIEGPNSPPKRFGVVSRRETHPRREAEIALQTDLLA
jgi:hypothetical protein